MSSNIANLGSLLKDLEHFMTTKTVVGEAIHIGDTILVPLVDVSFGMGAGGSNSSKLKEKNKDKERYVDGPSETSGGGIGAHITPSAMLVIQNGTTQLVNIKAQDGLTKIIDMVPGLVANLPDMIAQIKGNKEEAPTDNTEDFHNLEK
ncbi:MAG: sporulation protein [Epulopiscium sp. Nele67-Bin005]|nr:MAG: sporulation protein [Epulopiscium sp. Nele67-Bin005]